MRVLPVLAALAAIATGCGPSMPDVRRIDPNQQTDISGRWNDTDSRLVSEAMIDDVLKAGWLPEFTKKMDGKKPRLIVGTIRNRSLEHINVGTFVNDLERAITNSRKAVFVASKSERDEVREERFDQADNARADTRKEAGQEYGADYMLKGEINSVVDSAGGIATVFYQVNLTLIDLESNEKVWIGEKKIKKVMERGAYSM